MMSNLFQEFKNKTGLRTQDIERETVYTRQGLIYSFNQLETTGKCSKPFEKAMDHLIVGLMKEEENRNIQRLYELESIACKIYNR